MFYSKQLLDDDKKKQFYSFIFRNLNSKLFSIRISFSTQKVGLDLLVPLYLVVNCIDFSSGHYVGFIYKFMVNERFISQGYRDQFHLSMVLFLD